MSRKLLLKVFVIGFLALSSIPVFALTAAQKLIEQMSISSKTLNYKGFFAYERGQQSSSFEIIHKLDGESEKQRLVFLDGEPFEIVSNGHKVELFHQGDVSSADYRSFIDEINPIAHLNKSLESIWQNYAIEIEGTDRVAGREVTRVRLDPKDNDRFTYVFFVDTETNLMLKMLISDVQGKPLERFHYVSIQYNNVSNEDLTPQIPHVKALNKNAVEEVVAPVVFSANQIDQSWQLTWIPVGFLAEKATIFNRESSQSIATSQLQTFNYSDGLSSFSVFIDVVENEIATDTSSSMGSTSAISHYTSYKGRLFLVTVVGEIPIMTAKQIALSVRPAT